MSGNSLLLQSLMLRAATRWLVACLLVVSIAACGSGGGDSATLIAAVQGSSSGSGSSGSATNGSSVIYSGNTLVVKGVPFTQPSEESVCGSRTAADKRCYQQQRVALWVRKSHAAEVDSDLLRFGLAVVDRVVHECAGDDRELWTVAVPGGFELQWLLAMRFFLSIVAAMILPSPLAPSDPFADPLQMISFFCALSRN